MQHIALVFAVLLAMAGCTGDPGRAPYVTQAAGSCPAMDALTAQRSTVPLPADFSPVSAVRCTTGGLDLSASADPTGFTWVAEHRSTGPFDDLVRALRLPPQELDSDLVCPAILLPPTLLALTDASGHSIRPALPGTVCGTPVHEVRSALDALTWVEIARRE